jgi:cytochrome P450
VLAKKLNLGKTVSLTRKALKDFTFSDGTIIPKGAFVSVSSYAMHHDEDHYEAPEEFRGTRFEAMRDPSNPGGSARLQMISTSPDYLLFGYGKHACPGRFFAVNELKIILSHLVLNYDVKYEKEGYFPNPDWFGPSLLPNRTAKVMFRERV